MIYLLFNYLIIVFTIAYKETYLNGKIPFLVAKNPQYLDFLQNLCNNKNEVM